MQINHPRVGFDELNRFSNSGGFPDMLDFRIRNVFRGGFVESRRISELQRIFKPKEAFRAREEFRVRDAFGAVDAFREDLMK